MPMDLCHVDAEAGLRALVVLVSGMWDRHIEFMEY